MQINIPILNNEEACDMSGYAIKEKGNEVATLKGFE